MIHWKRNSKALYWIYFSVSPTVVTWELSFVQLYANYLNCRIFTRIASGTWSTIRRAWKRLAGDKLNYTNWHWQLGVIIFRENLKIELNHTGSMIFTMICTLVTNGFPSSTRYYLNSNTYGSNLRFFDDILLSRTNSNGAHRDDL